MEATVMSTGIYKISNTFNGKFYIGSAVNIEKRWRTHKTNLAQGKHHSRHLQSAWNKYGAGAFEFSVIEACSVFALIFREQHFIDTLCPEYNISHTAGSSLGVKHTEDGRRNNSDAQKGKTFSSEHREKLSAAAKNRTAEHREKLSTAHKGKTFSDETRGKMSEARKGNSWNKGKKLSETTRLKMSESQKAMWQRRKETATEDT
jgi:group I intron endonuclease